MSEPKHIGIVGSGLMGAGIAEVAALAGLPVTLVKATPGDPESARARIRASMAARVAKGKLAAEDADRALAMITATCDVDFGG